MGRTERIVAGVGEGKGGEEVREAVDWTPKICQRQVVLKDENNDQNKNAGEEGGKGEETRKSDMDRKKRRQ